MTVIAYSYERFSDPAQGKGDSSRRQTSAAEAYALEHGLVLDDSLRDRGVSAYRGAHRQTGALSRFLGMISDGHVAAESYLLIDSFDRLSREEVTQALGLLLDITRKGVVVVTLNDGKKFGADADMFGLMWALMEFARAHSESKEKGRKVGEARKRERQRARETLAPFSPVGPHWLRLQTVYDDAGRKVGAEWVEIPERVKVVREIFAAKETLGYAAIARRLNQRGELTPRPRRDAEGNVTSVWTEATVGDLIGSRAVLGEYAPHIGHRKAGKREPDGLPISGFYPAVIEQAQFDRVHAAIAARQNPHAQPRSSRFKNLLIGHVRCSCGGTVGYLESGRLKDGRRSAALRCPGVYRGVCDNRARLNYARVEAELLPFLAGLPGSEPKTVAAVALRKAQNTRSDLLGVIANLTDQAEHSRAITSRLIQREEELLQLEAQIAGLEAEAMKERAAVAAPDWRPRMAAMIEQMETAEGEALFALRSRLNAMIGQAVQGGFEFRDGRLFAILNRTRAKGRPPLFHRTAESLIQWEFAPLTPSFEQVRAGLTA